MMDRYIEDAGDVQTHPPHDDKNVIRIVVISDTHMLHDRLELPPGDVLIHCGDFTNRDSVEGVRMFRDWFQAQTQYADRVVVGGNHEDDLVSATGMDLQAEMTPSKDGAYHFLQDETITIAGGRLRVHGLSWKTCQKDEYDGVLTWTKNEPLDLLISHMPARFHGHKPKPPLGSHNLATFVVDHQVPVCCSGHFHWGRGAIQNVQASGESWFINASNKLYDETLFPVIVFDYNVQSKSVTNMAGLEKSQITTSVL